MTWPVKQISETEFVSKYISDDEYIDIDECLWSRYVMSE